MGIKNYSKSLSLEDIKTKERIYDNLYKLLTKRGFKIALLGTDFNLTGNALFVRHKL
jgi:hypothetical protein